MAPSQPGMSSGAGDVSPTGSNPGSSTTNPKMRKRTKTGCLTCRKRRIKCGEERPTCANCIKSKRQCEGYNQRVIFKPPIGDWPNHPGVVSNLQYHTSMLPGSRPQFRNSQPSAQPQDAQHSMQPRPIQFDFNIDTGHGPNLDHLNTQSVLVSGPPSYAHDQQLLPSPHHQQPLPSPLHQQSLHSPHHQLPTPTSATSYFPSQPSPVHASYPAQYSHSGSVSYEAQQRFPPQGQYQQTPASYDASIDQKPTTSQATTEQGLYQQTGAAHDDRTQYVAQSYLPARTEGYAQHLEQAPHLSRYPSNPQLAAQQPQSSRVNYSQGGQYTQLSATSYQDSTHSSLYSQIPQHEVNSDVKYLPQHAPVLGMSRV